MQDESVVPLSIGDEFSIDFPGYAGKKFRVVKVRDTQTRLGRYVDAIWKDEPGDPGRPFSAFTFSVASLGFYNERGQLRIVRRREVLSA